MKTKATLIQSIQSLSHSRRDLVDFLLANKSEDIAIFENDTKYFPECYLALTIGGFGCFARHLSSEAGRISGVLENIRKGASGLFDEIYSFGEKSVITAEGKKKILAFIKENGPGSQNYVTLISHPQTTKAFLYEYACLVDAAQMFLDAYGDNVAS